MGLRIIVTGATGLAGSEVVRQAILDPGIDTISALARRPSVIRHPKLQTVLHENYRDYSLLKGLFTSHDACIWCLGISQTQVPQDEYIRTTYEFAVTAAQAMLAANPAMAFLFLSSAGADSQEQSRMLFARIKGKTENNLKRLPFKKLWIARPGAIIPVHKKENAPLYEKWLLPAYPLLKLLMPGMTISSDMLAKAMLDVVKHGSPKITLSNRDLKKRAGT